MTLDIHTEYLKTGKKEGKIDNYPRYWHGYLLFIKPALIFFNISQIYAINTIIVFGLFIAALFFVYKYAGTGGAVSLLAALGVVNPVSVASCLQYTPVYVITLMAVIGAAVLPEKYRSLLFCGAGILTAYFDRLRR